MMDHLTNRTFSPLNPMVQAVYSTPSFPNIHNHFPPKVPSYLPTLLIVTGHIALGWVVVIALVISLFLILLLVIGGLIAARIRRAREGYVKAPGTPPIRETTLGRLPPEQLLEDLERRRGYAVV